MSPIVRRVLRPVVRQDVRGPLRLLDQLQPRVALDDVSEVGGDGVLVALGRGRGGVEVDEQAVVADQVQGVLRGSQKRGTMSSRRVQQSHTKVHLSDSIHCAQHSTVSNAWTDQSNCSKWVSSCCRSRDRRVYT